MIRFISITATGAFILGVVLLFVDAGAYVVPAILLILLSLVLGTFLGLRRLYKRVREIVDAVRTFVTGDVRHARIVDVGEPKGIFGPTAETTLEVEGDEGHVHRVQVDMPVPFPAAIAYRLGRRFKVPIIGRRPLSELMAVELKREGLKLSAGWRPPADAEVIEVGRLPA